MKTVRITYTDDELTEYTKVTKSKLTSKTFQFVSEENEERRLYIVPLENVYAISIDSEEEDNGSN